MSKLQQPTSISYRDAGVDIDAGNQLVSRIKDVARATHDAKVLNGLGGFAAMVELPVGKYRRPVMVSATDGVGTKLKLAIESGNHDGIGIDLVAMCVNDLIVCGAEPLFFLDYYATGKLNVDAATAVISSIAEGCKQAGASLVGGETAEMPGMYQAGDYDLAGFAVGVVEHDEILDGSRVQAGDQLIGIASSGPHSNGYSLIRKIIETNQIDLHSDVAGRQLIEHLLMPTLIYVKPILHLAKQIQLHALAHITGGGITENLPRVLPAQHQAIINRNSWSLPPIFSWLQQQGNLSDSELLRTFNCGIGMIVCVANSDLEATQQIIQSQGLSCYHIGEIRRAENSEPIVNYQG